MKKLLVPLFCLLFIGSQLYSQTRKGSIEVSTSGTFGSYTSETEFTSGSYHSSSKSESYEYFVLALRTGLFPTDNLEIEPEFQGTFVKDSEPSFSIAGNLVYNFNIPGSRVTPFALAGYGVSNSIPFLNTLLIRNSDGMDVGFLNLGLGIRTFVSESAAIRIEYRYQNLKYDRSGTGYENSTTFNFHKLLFGVSIFM